jgi:hypothetical protein
MKSSKSSGQLTEWRPFGSLLTVRAGIQDGSNQWDAGLLADLGFNISFAGLTLL